MIAPTSVPLLAVDTTISRYRVHWIGDVRQQLGNYTLAARANYN